MPRRLVRRTLPVVVGLGTATAVVLSGAGTAAAADVPVSQATGFFLDGAIAGTPLSTVVALTPAKSVNYGGPAVPQSNPLGVDLAGMSIPLGGGVSLPLTDAGLDFGTLNQYAIASPDGSAAASSGAIADNGAINSGTAGGDAGTATISLGAKSLAALGSTPLSDLVGDIGSVDLTAGALAARATQDPFRDSGTAGAQAGAYRIGSLTLDVTGGPLITGVLAGLTDAASTFTDAVNQAIAAYQAAQLGPVTVTGSVPDGGSVFDGLTSVKGTGYEFDLADGSVHLDVAALIKAELGKDINALPVDTDLVELITQALTKLLPSIEADLAGQLETKADQFVAAFGNVTIAVAGIPVPIDATPITTLLDGFSALQTAFEQAVAAFPGQLGSAVGQLTTALRQLLGLVANHQVTAGGAFTQTALQLALLPMGLTGSPLTSAGLALDLANASVGPGAPLVVTTATPTPTTPVPMLADTGPHGLRDSAVGVWAVVTGLGLVAFGTAARTARTRRAGAHRA